MAVNETAAELDLEDAEGKGNQLLAQANFGPTRENFSNVQNVC